MAYEASAVEKLFREHSQVQRDLENLLLEIVHAGRRTESPQAKEQLLRGAGRRLSVLRSCLSNVFEKFPPSATKPIPSSALDEVNISLHAFVMNLYGFFENLGWAYVLRHNLESQVGSSMGVGLFKKATQKHLPAALKVYLTSNTMETWHKEYLKNYRDALAHRIPLYVPPFRLTPEEQDRFNALEREKLECLTSERLDRLEEIREEQASLGSAYAVFLHSFEGDDRSKAVQLHPQMLCDAMSVVECGRLYLKHWHETA